jgi:hypothetical protein
LPSVLNYLAQGKKSQARKDLERILAEDSNYAEVRTSSRRSTVEQGPGGEPNAGAERDRRPQANLRDARAQR